VSIFASGIQVPDLNHKNMKKYILPLALMSALAIAQGCSSKAEEKAAAEKAATEEAATAKLVKIKSAEELAAKRAKIAKARAEKEEQRTQAIAEKAKLSPTYKDASGKIVYYKAEIDPAYDGGIEAMRQYLKDNIKYPEQARENGQEGTVFVDFVVDEKGRVREVVASEYIGDDVDVSFKDESVRVVSSMPAWKPGRQHGKAVDTSFSIPITFEIEN
jgi:TonB family protein